MCLVNAQMISERVPRVRRRCVQHGDDANLRNQTDNRLPRKLLLGLMAFHAASLANSVCAMAQQAAREVFNVSSPSGMTYERSYRSSDETGSLLTDGKTPSRFAISYKLQIILIASMGAVLTFLVIGIALYQRSDVHGETGMFQT